MSLHDTLRNALLRFRPHHPSAPANTFVFGFVAPGTPSLSVSIGWDHVRLITGIREAEYLISGPSDLIAALFDPNQVNRAAIVSQLTMRPAYPFNNYLLSILLNALNLAIPDLDYEPKRFDGPYPFPPRYPAAENVFRMQSYVPQELPEYDATKLPALIVDDHPLWVSMYIHAWQLAFSNLRLPEPESGFIASFIDTPFNANSFLWDSCFMMMFGRYGRRVFPFMGTLDNFYAKQDDDGFICREINTFTGASVFQSLDPRSTGPNILAWTELLYHEISGNVDRLRQVFPAVIAYHQWWNDWRMHPDGGCWTSGWGSGMDNQTRVPHSEYHHRGYTWIDATFQQALSCEALLRIAKLIDRHEFDDELASQLDRLSQYANAQMWDDKRAFYFDRAPDGSLSDTRSIAAYWGLLTHALPDERAERMMAWLNDSETFRRPHRVPAQAYDSADYNPYGGYWLGGVWSPTNYMTLRGLSVRGAHALAHEIAHNHVDNVAQVYAQTGTLWENYSPEYPEPGRPAGKNFVGWTGVSAISIPIEYLAGIRSTGYGTGLHWDIRLTERHGILRYPLGDANTVDLICERRASVDSPAKIHIRTEEPLHLKVTLALHDHEIDLPAGEHLLSL